MTAHSLPCNDIEKLNQSCIRMSVHVSNSFNLPFGQVGLSMCLYIRTPHVFLFSSNSYSIRTPFATIR